MTSFDIYSPGGNLTALVNGRFDKQQADAVGQEILERHRQIEQIGFVISDSSGKRYLQMLGNEFCANAARAAALQWFRDTGLKESCFMVSGFERAVQTYVAGKNVSLILPREFLISSDYTSDGFFLEFSGINFLVVTNPMSEADLQKHLEHYALNAPAAGVVEVYQDQNGWRIVPHILVRGLGRIVTETACGSGSIAAALHLYRSGSQQGNYTIRQPSGSYYNVQLLFKNKELEGFKLTGEVEFCGSYDLCA